MTVWLVDCGPLGHVAALAEVAWDWPGDTLHVVREVAHEALASGSVPNEQLLHLRSGEQPWVQVHDLPIPSPAAEMLALHLRPAATSASRNLGEDASIAFCATMNQDAIFVAADKSAAFVALAELGRSRVASPFDLWEALRDEGRIPAEAFEKLCGRTARQLGGVLPGVPWRLRQQPRQGG
ncbi:MAG: hypothetical protein HY744_02355 [Deltaproteobacteria bacterium]|nr:hypothetical protein [Deltaproteobacteria bacterium]